MLYVVLILSSVSY